MVTPSELFTRGLGKALLTITFGCLGKQPRRQPVVITRGLSKALLILFFWLFRKAAQAAASGDSLRAVHQGS